MPLSEHEQRLLEQMERALLAEDPKFATSMSASARARADRRGAAIGVVTFIGGLGLLVFGVASKLVALGVLGFLAMLGGAYLTIRALKHRSDAASALPTNVSSIKRAKSKKPKSSSLSDRMEERWRQRRERGEF